MSLPLNTTYDDIYEILNDLDTDDDSNGSMIADFIERLAKENDKKDETIKELKEEMLELYDEEGARENCEVLGLVPEDEYNAMKLMYENSQYQLESLETDKRIKTLKEELILARCEEKMTEHHQANKKFKEELRELGMKVCS